MSVTNIVMLVKDRSELTLQALKSLHAHTDPTSYNLTIIDDASRNDWPWWTPNEFDSDNVRPAVLKIHVSKGITGQARNLGVYWAEKYWGRGDFLYLSDNDVYFKEGWLGLLTSTFLAMETVGLPIAILGGGNHPYLRPNGVIRGSQLEVFPNYGNREGEAWQVYTHDGVPGYTQLMRWETWDDFGPLDAHQPGVSRGEDSKMCDDLRKDGSLVASIWPEVVLACGLTHTDGTPATGANVMPRYPGILQQ